MNFLSLEYFLAGAEDRSFTAASYRLYVSQQSLSEHIKKLEEEIGTKLILRKRPLELTEAGQIFAEGARSILNTRSAMLRDITDTLNHDERKLTISVSAFEAPPFLPEFLSFFSSQYPNIDLNVIKRADSTISETMDGVNFHFSLPPLSDRLEHYYFIRNDYACIVTRQSLMQRIYGDEWEAVAKELRRTGDLNVVPELPFTILKDFSGKIAAVTQMLFDAFGFKPVVSFQSDNGELNSAFCRRGDGARIGAFFHMHSRFEDALDDEKNPMLLFPLRTKRESLPLVISYQKSHTLNPVEKSFISCFRDFLADYTASHFMRSAYAVDNLPAGFFY